ncbi:hypothetical protein PsorP6_017567 [Peronosclerospora sorghi]|uniref:Uncharacterized protein n=1 Tax=Peronosclerospora sorghi TaxID=230839 RepID=A0ACC0WKR9_9STRA|nr:hypothetical protein PsorP6_017567 [Peronosclerospora sorghi]
MPKWLINEKWSPSQVFTEIKLNKNKDETKLFGNPALSHGCGLRREITLITHSLSNGLSIWFTYSLAKNI